MHEIDLKQLSAAPFSLFSDRWALLTAGPMTDYNTMTISWGSLGTLWSRAVATVYVSPARYTYQFMEKNELFTISFFPQEHHSDLALLGSESGRNGDKVSKTQLTPIDVDGCTCFAQADLTLICRKMYADPFDASRAPEDIQRRLYASIPAHHFYVGEVLKVLVK